MDLTRLLFDTTSGEGTLLESVAASTQGRADDEAFRAELALLLASSQEEAVEEGEPEISPALPFTVRSADEPTEPGSGSASETASTRPGAESGLRFLMPTRRTQADSEEGFGEPGEKASKAERTENRSAGAAEPVRSDRAAELRVVEPPAGPAQERTLSRPVPEGRTTAERAEVPAAVRGLSDRTTESDPSGETMRGTDSEGGPPFWKALRDPVAVPLRERTGSATVAEVGPRPAVAHQQSLSPFEATGQERPEGAEKSGESHSPPLSRSEEVLSRIVEQIRLLRSGELRTLEVRLKPDFLGKVRIETVLDKGNLLKVRIGVEEPRVRALLESQLPTLQEHFARAGLRVESVEIRTLPSADFSADPSQSQARRNEEEIRGRPGAFGGEKANGPTEAERELEHRVRLVHGRNYWIA